MNKFTVAALGFGLGVAGLAQAQSQLSLYNVITKGAFDTTSDVEGKVVAYSIGSSGATYAQKLSGSKSTDINVAIQTALPSGNPINMQYGSMYAPSNPNNRIINFNQSGGALKTSPAFDFNTVFNGITTESTAYSGYSATGSKTWDSAQNTETLKVTSLRSGGVAVFSLSASDLNHANESLALNLNGFNPTAIIINVNASNFSGNSTDYWSLNQFQSLASKVLWNFYNAGAVALNSAWYGSVLAPSASLSSQGVITGSVGVSTFSTQQEVHLAPWTGVPEASTVTALGFVALGAGLTLARRRSVLV
ncbi:MAG TPA: choice-of-anchor A family protein [Candidatus Limnocylindria bacterium]|jgi:choice-of-anchor A domain-containing protein|nr:choice-of-anchor A family protein [Candidatus Limnocylindria bacterium]